LFLHTLYSSGLLGQSISYEKLTTLKNNYLET